MHALISNLINKVLTIVIKLELVAEVRPNSIARSNMGLSVSYDVVDYLIELDVLEPRRRKGNHPTKSLSASQFFQHESDTAQPVSYNFVIYFGRYHFLHLMEVTPQTCLMKVRFILVQALIPNIRNEALNSTPTPPRAQNASQFNSSIVRSSKPSFNVIVHDDGSVLWKDVVLNLTYNLWHCLYKPADLSSSSKLPIFYYIHGGGFCIDSFTWPKFHKYCLRLASDLRVVIIAQDYRLALENRLPTAMDDVFAAVKGLQAQATSDNRDLWLTEVCNFSWVFISGDSTSGNLAHCLAVWLGRGLLELAPVRVRGYILLEPFFSSIVRTKLEAEGPKDAFLNLELMDRFWRLSIPIRANRDHPLLNPFGPSSKSLEGIDLDLMLVVVGGSDLLRERCKDYANRLKNWGKNIETLSSSARDSNTANDPASDPALLQSVKKLHEICVAENSEDLVARVYPQINKIFQRAVASLSQSRTSNGLLLLAVLQFFLDFGEVVLHDADPSLRILFRSCLSREFADPVVAEATLEFLIVNRKKFQSSFPNLLPQFFPLLLKLVAWHGERLDVFTTIEMIRETIPESFTGLISSGSFLPLFISLVDLPILVVALEKVEKSSGPLLGNGIASIQQNTAPKMLLALMDEAYTGSTIEDGAGDSESEDSSAIDVDSPLFLELLKDENDGLAERHWTSPGMAALLQAAVNSPYSDRLKQVLTLAPPLLDVYFSIALHEVNESLLCALIPLLMSRYSTIFPDKNFSHEVHKRILEFMLSAFQHSPNFIAVLKKPIMDRLGEAYDSPEKTELALQLCWAIGEHGGGGDSHKDEARELFESLELLLYENLSTSRLGLRQDVSRSSDKVAYSKSSQSRLLCFVITAIAKLATHHRELLPRARVSLGKVARSQISDARVWRRARDFLGLMNEPAICSSILGPSRPSQGTKQKAGSINWNEGATKMIAHIPFYLLGELEGAPFHDFSFSEVIPRR
ncbi:hypothetical protein K1719_034933 [Acacia pycnantha]|nr:hypothetical protein K1719_034933 [Acacia pycnantha]